MYYGTLLYEFFIFPAIRFEWRDRKRIEICWLRFVVGFCKLGDLINEFFRIISCGTY